MVAPPVAELRPGPHREQRVAVGVDHDEPAILGAHDRDPVRPLVDAEQDRRLLAEVLDEDLAGVLGVAAPLEHQVALELAGARASWISLVPDHQCVRAVAAISSASTMRPSASSACLSANGPHDHSFGCG